MVPNVEDDDDAEDGVGDVGKAAGGVGQELHVAVGELGEEFRRVVGVHSVEGVQFVCVVTKQHYTFFYDFVEVSHTHPASPASSADSCL